MSALNKQVGGNHYKIMAMQPMEFALKYNLNAIDTKILKYTSRHKFKNGVEDIDKVSHTCELAYELEFKELEFVGTRNYYPIDEYIKVNKIDGLEREILEELLSYRMHGDSHSLVLIKACCNQIKEQQYEE